MKSVSKDMLTVVAIVVALLASFYLVSIGIGIAIAIGFIVPGWAVLLFLLITINKKRKKLRV